MKAILHNFPDVLETERLIVRCPRAGDGPQLYAATLESLEALRAFPASMPWAMTPPSVETSEVYCRDSYVNFMARRDLPFIMQLRGSDTIVGSGGLHGCDWTTRKFEAGWWGRTSYLGRGLITEGVEAMLQFAFTMLHAHRVEAFSDDLNSRSCLLCERVGMTLEGVMRHARVDPDGTLRNTRIYAKVA